MGVFGDVPGSVPQGTSVVLEGGDVKSLTETNVSRTSKDENGILDKLLDDLVKVAEKYRNPVEEARKKEEKSFMEKMLPMMVMPFMVSTSMIPMMMVSLVGMMFKSAIIGKIGIILMLVNMFRNRPSNGGGVSSHNVQVDRETAVAMEHYGYKGDEEYGAYVNRRRRNVKS